MSDCYCDYEPAQFYDANTRIARKRHRCNECGHTIAPGEQYEIVNAKWYYNDSISVYRTCCRCLAVRVYVKDHVPCFCWAHGNMLDDAREMIDSYAHELPGMYMGYGRLQVAVNRGQRWAA
jgi:hypothetical protein